MKANDRTINSTKTMIIMFCFVIALISFMNPSRNSFLLSIFNTQNSHTSRQKYNERWGSDFNGLGARDFSLVHETGKVGGLEPRESLVGIWRWISWRRK